MLSRGIGDAIETLVRQFHERRQLDMRLVVGQPRPRAEQPGAPKRRGEAERRRCP